MKDSILDQPSIADIALGSRNIFLHQLDELPTGLRDVAFHNYQARVKKANNNALLGEYAPWLLADLLPVKNKNSASSIAESWMNIYAYTLFMDDILDVSGKQDAAPLLIASGLILGRGLSSLYACLPHQGNVRIQIDKYFTQAAHAAIDEINFHRGILSPYNDVNAIGDKVSLLKMCAVCVLIADGQVEISDEVLVPVGVLATGMQLLDDMADWEEDFEARSYSHLLTQAIIYLQSFDQQEMWSIETLTKKELFTAIVVSGAMTNTLDKALDCLSEVKFSAHVERSSAAYQLISTICDENMKFRDEVFQLSARLKHEQDLYLKRNFGKEHWLTFLSSQDELSEMIEGSMHKCKIIAQST